MGALALALIFLTAEVCYRFPHYLAYFNGVITPARAYRHIVDSSLDWGQDLPGVRDYLAARQLAGPNYLFYFGSANPAYYRVAAIHGHSIHDRHHTPPLEVVNVAARDMERYLRELVERHPEYDQAAAVAARTGDQVSLAVPKKPTALRLAAGRYLISATLLQPVTAPGRGAFGPWNERVEKEYQRLRQFVAPMLSDDVTARQTLLGRYGPETLRQALDSHDYLRFRRLTSFLRQREPEDNIGYSILVYHLREDELARALDGSPVELGRDILSEIFGSPSQSQR